MSKISELSDGGSLVSTDFLIAVRSGGNVKVQMDTINVDQVDLGDNEMIRLGNSQDLTLVHTSTQSIINQAGVGDLLIQKGGTTKLTINSSGINVTGSVVGSNGSASAPTYSFSNDSDTGMFLSSVGYLALTVAGSKQLEFGGSVIYTATTGKIRSASNNGSLELSGGGASVGGQILLSGGTSNSDITFKAGANSSTPPQRMHISSNGDISFYEDTGTTPKFFWDASAESLGIGTDSPATAIHLSGATGAAPKLTFEEGGAESRIYATKNSPTNSDLRFQTEIGGTISDRVVIDYAGNMLVGKTTTALATAGLTLGGAGFASLTRSGAEPLNVNRLSSDGNLVVFYKDSTAVGSVGTIFDDLYIGTGDTNLRFDDSNDAITPRGSGGSARDAAISLGSPSVRFADLNLSGAASMGSLSPGIVTISTGSYFIGNATNGYRFNNAADTSNLMILKDDGNLLVGKTTTTNARIGTGHIIRGGDSVLFSRDAGGETMQICRNADDGDLVRLYSNAVQVGNIGTQSGDLNIGTTNCGLLFNDGTPIIIPNNVSTNAVADASIDLGYSAGRFKDLYLSGGVYLGGTGAANKLEDYEEGTWTPSNAGNITINTIHNATYTKIGRQVTVSAWLKVNIASSNGIIGGLPFSVYGRSTASVSNLTQRENLNTQALSSSIYFYDATTTGTNDDVLISFTYDI